MNEHERQLGPWPTDDATLAKYAAADAMRDRRPIERGAAQARSMAPAGEQTGTDHAEPPIPRASEAEVMHVVVVLHEQADRLMVDAGRMAQRAAATRATAAEQDRQADDLEWRADRLHAQADQLRDETPR